MSTLIRGHLVHLTGSPRLDEAETALEAIADGALLVNDEGRILWKGRYVDRPAPEGAGHEVVDYGDAYILPGFIDTHLHFGQVNSIAAWGGGQLLEWLSLCIFPAEARLANPEFAAGAAREFCTRLIRAGTTTSMVVGSPFPEAQNCLFSEYERRGLRGIIGRGIQTVGPDSARALCTSEEDALRLTMEEIERWHPEAPEVRAKSLLQVALMPRFSLSVTPKTLAALGELYDAWRSKGLYFSSHLNENNRPGDGEIAEVCRSYQVDQYLDTYDGKFLPGGRRGGLSLLGRRSVFAHAVHCTDQELARMAETGSSIAHCPTSQLFLGSGTMPWRRTAATGVNIAAGTDLAGGDVWFLPEVLNACYKVHINEPGDAGVALHPARLLFTATLAGARALDLEDRIGNLDPGKEADLVVLDPTRRQVLANSLEWAPRADDPALRRDTRLFTLLMAAREENVVATWVRGRLLDREDGGAD